MFQLAAAVVVAFSFDVWPRIGTLPGRTGLHAAAILTAVLFAVVMRVEGGPVALIRRFPKLSAALLGCVVAALLPAPWAAEPLRALVAGGRIVVALAFAVSIGLLVARDRHTTARWLGGAAFVVLSVHLLLFLAALAVPSLRPALFEEGAHQHTGPIGRYHGPFGSPAVFGLLTLGCFALTRRLHAPWRHISAASAAVLCVASMSFATLGAPFFVALWLVPWRRIRIVVAAAAAVFALVVLFIKPLTVQLGDLQDPSAAYRISDLHPSYHASGMGPIHTPIHRTEIGPIAATWHASHYLQCIDAALRCAPKHPLVGVGARNFFLSCPITSMDSYGKWEKGRHAHSQYFGLLAEHGALGVLAALALIVVLVGKFRVGPPRDAPTAHIESAIFAWVLLSGFQAIVLYQLPIAGWLATALHPRQAAAASAGASA